MVGATSKAEVVGGAWRALAFGGVASLVLPKSSDSGAHSVNTAQRVDLTPRAVLLVGAYFKLMPVRACAALQAADNSRLSVVCAAVTNVADKAAKLANTGNGIRQWCDAAETSPLFLGLVVCVCPPLLCI